MSPTIYNSIFLLTSIYILIKVIFFGIYEIKDLKNKVGGYITISLSVLIVIFSNIMIWLH